MYLVDNYNIICFKCLLHLKFGQIHKKYIYRHGPYIVAMYCQLKSFFSSLGHFISLSQIPAQLQLLWIIMIGTARVKQFLNRNLSKWNLLITKQWETYYLFITLVVINSFQRTIFCSQNFLCQDSGNLLHKKLHDTLGLTLVCQLQ